MLNNNQKQNPAGNFWFGFVLGGILGVSCLFLLGTKKGRRLLKKTLEASEELENYLAEMVTEIEEKVEESKEKLENKLPKTTPSKTVDTVLQKIRSAL
jgi:Sec-independent protein translocase protein TatA